MAPVSSCMRAMSGVWDTGTADRRWYRGSVRSKRDTQLGRMQEDSLHWTCWTPSSKSIRHRPTYSLSRLAHHSPRLHILRRTTQDVRETTRHRPHGHCPRHTAKSWWLGAARGTAAGPWLTCGAEMPKCLEHQMSGRSRADKQAHLHWRQGADAAATHAT